ncbi:coiled-coil-helix-coiled-coil-helix domain containing 4b isoform X2 [Siphateles boraxobius]|uniref:coiled-coil-helix-coiled-coil-helix domain containing 4b isoform X2 n=1 Tax=Siphateles boraxobius TaxID=180520 RepID=UPI004064BDE8
MTAINGEGKDQVIFVTKEEHEIPSTVELVEEDSNEDNEEKGGMASGVCGEQFKTAFTCFHLSQEELKGSDCLEQFRSMQECFGQHPELFPQEDDLQTAYPGPDSEQKQKDSPSISDFSTSEESGPLSSQLPIAT